MERKTIERVNGRFAKSLEGMDDFAKKVVKELCEKYPDIDFFDLEFSFKRAFNFAMSLELLEYSAKPSKEDNDVS
jgi:hypothetical protein